MRCAGCSGRFMAALDCMRIPGSRRGLRPRFRAAAVEPRANCWRAMPVGVEADVREQERGIAVIDERDRASPRCRIGTATSAAASASATALPAPPATTPSSTVTSASWSRARRSDELGVERLHEAHVGDRRVELLGRRERGLHHRIRTRGSRCDGCALDVVRRTSPLPTGSARIDGIDRHARPGAARDSARPPACRAWSPCTASAGTRSRRTAPSPSCWAGSAGTRGRRRRGASRRRRRRHPRGRSRT